MYRVMSVSYTSPPHFFCFLTWHFSVIIKFGHQFEANFLGLLHSWQLLPASDGRGILCEGATAAWGSHLLKEGEYVCKALAAHSYFGLRTHQIISNQSTFEDATSFCQCIEAYVKDLEGRKMVNYRNSPLTDLYVHLDN